MLTELRERLGEVPTLEGLEQIMALLYAYMDHADFEVALDYTEQHLDDWPDDWRIRVVTPGHPSLLASAPGRKWSNLHPLRLVRHLHCHSFRPQHAYRLSLNGWLCGLISLAVFGDSHDTISDYGAEAIGKCPYLSLEQLRLLRGGVSYRGAEFIANSPHMANLTDLRLNHNPIGSRGVAAIANSPYMANLQYLDIRETGFRRGGIMAIANSPYMANLEEIHIGSWDESWDLAGPLLESEHLSDTVKEFLVAHHARIRA